MKVNDVLSIDLTRVSFSTTVPVGGGKSSHLVEYGNVAGVVVIFLSTNVYYTMY